MTRFRLAVFGIVLAASAALAADPKTDLYGDPLPEGAIARLGHVGRATTNDLCLVPPGYTTYLGPAADGGVRRYDLATCRPVGPGSGPGAGKVRVSADGKRALVVRFDGQAAVCDVGTGKVVRELPPGVQTRPDSDGFSLSADGSRVAWAAGGEKCGTVKVWDVAKNAAAAEVKVPYNWAFTPILSPDGTTVAVGGQVPHRPDGKADPPVVRVYAVADGTGLCRIPVGPEPSGRLSMPALAFAPDGKTLAVGLGTGPVELWEVPSGKPVRTLLGRTGQGYRVAFSPDGKQVAAVGTTGGVEWWSLPDGRRVGSGGRPADVHQIDPLGVGFAPGGRVVAWARVEAVGVAWEPATGKTLTPPVGHYGTVGDVAFAAGGREVLTAGIGPAGGVVRW
ncbi:MAG: hypothetical protein K2X82_26105, partial [Gemmataceae bacterium]|nr:hypothetical protein [Gemmataceae bacterium]